MQGWRINMEDAHATILDMHDVKKFEVDQDDAEDKEHEVPKSNGVTNDDSDQEHVSFFGVYDGHGGEKAAIFAGEYLHRIIKATAAYSKKDYVNALKDGFLSCDQAILNDYNMRDDDSGCATTTAIITTSAIYCGNAGDSRTVMSIDGFAKALSYDHKPSNEGEKTRICSAGGYVDMGRVNGNLALSRGIGDFEFKKNIDLPAEEQIVTCYPDVIQHNIDFSKDEFVILACDGIWDCLTSQNAVECVRRGIFERKDFTTICEEMMELCCAPTSDGSGIGCDNMSIVIVALLDYTKKETLEQWYDRVIEKINISQSDEVDEKTKAKYGPVSSPYGQIYKEIYGQYYEIGQQAQSAGSRGAPSAQSGLGGYSMFGGLQGLRGNNTGFTGDEDNDDEENNDIKIANEGDEITANGAISLQKLLASNAITNENGVIYLDTSSAQSLLAHFGVPGAAEDVNFEDVEDLEDGEDVHDKHIEEDIDDDEE
ncbi:Protein phosphatase 2C 2 [Yamadazyma tenuis]|nr:Protein phosphatase 2C 2 [Yamadazyma tenuis]